MVNIDTQALPLVLLVAVNDTSGMCLPISMLVSCAGQNSLLRSGVISEHLLQSRYPNEPQSRFCLVR